MKFNRFGKILIVLRGVLALSDFAEPSSKSVNLKAKFADLP